MKPPATIKSEPVTYSDFFELGIEEEESGDRWIISDLSKSVRHYHRAIQYYQNSIDLNPSGESNFDAWFNKCRLNFHIFSTLKDVHVDAELQNVSECESVLNIRLDDVRVEHEDIIRGFNDDERIINWDFYYDYGLVLIELVESGDHAFEELETFITNGAQLFNKLLDFLTAELDQFIQRLNGSEELIQDNSEQSATSENENEPKEYTMIEQVTPKVVFDSVLTTLKFIQVSLEASENPYQVEHYKRALTGLLNRAIGIKQVLIEKFNPQNDNVNDLNLSQEEVFESELTLHSIKGLFITDLSTLTAHWDAFAYKENQSARYLAESDSIQSFTDHYFDELTTSEVQWEALGYINKCLRTAQDLIKVDLQDQVNKKSSLISNRVSKSVEILINRADNELRRSQLKCQKSDENRDVHKRNVIALLKNGLTLSETNCGLREIILDRLKREKLRRECIVRLVVFTNTRFTKDDLIRNLGINYYLDEYKELAEVEPYKEHVLKFADL